MTARAAACVSRPPSLNAPALPTLIARSAGILAAAKKCVRVFRAHAGSRCGGARSTTSIRTVVHRRFKEFAELEEAVSASLAGHHMQSSLPRLPTKQLKLLTDHRDAAFIESRRRDLRRSRAGSSRCRTR